MSKFEKKIVALRLRREGKSIATIAHILGLSKSTASLWCRDIKMSRLQKAHLKKTMIDAGHFGRAKGALVNKQKRINSIKEADYFGDKTIGVLSDRDILVIGTALYWAEGGKKDNKFSFSNSDPRMVVFMCKWLRSVFNIKSTEIMPRIFINELHEDRIKEVLTFWSSLLKLPSEQFDKVTLLRVKNKKVYENKNSYFGVLSLRVRRSSGLVYKVLGMIKKMK